MRLAAGRMAEMLGQLGLKRRLALQQRVGWSARCGRFTPYALIVIDASGYVMLERQADLLAGLVAGCYERGSPPWSPPPY